MDEVMGNLLVTTKNNNKPFFKSPWFIIFIGIFLSIIVFLSLSYGYSYYEKSLSSKNSQVNVQQQLDKLLAAKDVTEYDWMRTLNPKAKAIEGGIVWSQERQLGIMTFENLPALSKKQQYRLWLYDRNSEQAISGATFRQNSFDNNSRLVKFLPKENVASLYKFILSLENIDGTEEEQILLRVQP